MYNLRDGKVSALMDKVFEVRQTGMSVMKHKTGLKILALTLTCMYDQSLLLEMGT
ncbi:unnamed protein product [Fusarium graminearum]|nr:unnamed protein product [Fusarium graminearum]VTO94471.1 unnamed protein product [Fusarium graminearum]